MTLKSSQCPNCNQRHGITLFQRMIKMSYKGIACTNCQVRLKLSMADLMAVLIPVLFIISFTPLLDGFHWSISILLAAAITIPFGMITSQIFQMKMIKNRKDT